MEEGLTDPQGLYATKFKEIVEANSDHTVQIYPVGSLGESADAMEQAQAGLLQFIDQSPGFTGALIPEAEAFLVPYIQPTDPQVVRKFFKEGVAINEMFHDIYREQGLELLAVFPEGEMVVTTMEEFRTPRRPGGHENPDNDIAFAAGNLYGLRRLSDCHALGRTDRRAENQNG